MSFILDALRKSENERRRRAAPGHADARVMPARQRRSPWIAIVAALLGVNIIVLAVFWFGWYRNLDPVSTSNKGTDASAAAPDNRKRYDSEISAAAPAENIHVRDLSEEAARSKTVDSTRSSSDTQRSGDASVAPVVASGATAGGNPAHANLPTMNEAIVAGTLSVPPLHLDIHVFSPSPAERFVFINMAKYREGERLQEGPAVEEITASGVVMTHQGNRFLLTRE